MNVLVAATNNDRFAPLTLFKVSSGFPVTYEITKQEDLWEWSVKNTVRGGDGLVGP